MTINIMGILNVTPNSFSNSNKYLTITDMLYQCQKLINYGINIIDIGGESTKPNAAPISSDEELSRILPIIIHIKKEFNIQISIDTYKYDIAEIAIKAGASIVNDITGGLYNEKMYKVISKYNAKYIITHNRGINSESMYNKSNYNNVINDVIIELQQKINTISQYNIKKNNIIIDPGIGFQKKINDNITLIQNINKLNVFNLPILIGISRKRFLSHIINSKDINALDIATAITNFNICNKIKNLFALRVHNPITTQYTLNLFKYFNQ